MTAILRGRVVLPHRVLEDGGVVVEGERITAVGEFSNLETAGATVIEHRGYVTPGYIDLHVHGGRGADFMDATEQAFETVVSAHARHGTTSIVPTTTVADRETILAVLETCRRQMAKPPQSSRILGAHFYGPYFGREARGCHPLVPLRDPDPEEFADYLRYADVIVSATVAPELAGAEAFARACHEHDIVVNVGHSHATFEQMEAAIGWGARHVDHLFCAMSDRAKLRDSQIYPMRGGVLEATLYFDELTTEVIADGKHLTRDLLLLALKVKGPDRLALVTDCNRALDMPDGEYTFGPSIGGERIVRRDDVGIMADGSALASGVQGMDHMVRTFRRLTGAPVHEIIRMATLTPARIIQKDHLVGSLAPRKRADMLLLDDDLAIQQVWVDGQPLDF